MRDEPKEHLRWRLPQELGGGRLNRICKFLIYLLFFYHEHVGFIVKCCDIYTYIETSGFHDLGRERPLRRLVLRVTQQAGPVRETCVIREGEGERVRGEK